MQSFKVANNSTNYRGGVSEELVKKGWYSISISGSNERLMQMKEVKIGDIFYMKNYDRTHYWRGVVKSEFVQLPPNSFDGGLSPISFWKEVNEKRINQNDVLTWAGIDERVCTVDWGEKTELGPDLKEILDAGFNAKTIKKICN